VTVKASAAAAPYVAGAVVLTVVKGPEQGLVVVVGLVMPVLVARIQQVWSGGG
jgi:hypothetical protein